MTRKYTVELAKQWCNDNYLNYFNESSYETMNQDQQKKYIDALLLLRGVTEYLNVFLDQDVDLSPNEIENFIFDESAYKLLIDPDYKGNIDDQGIDALVMIDEAGNLISEGSDVNKVDTILVFQAKNGTSERTGEAFKSPSRGLIQVLSPDNDKKDNLARNFVNKVIGLNIAKLEGASVYNVLLSGVRISDDAKNQLENWIEELNTSLKVTNVQINSDDPDIEDKSLVYVLDLEKKRREQLETRQEEKLFDDFTKELIITNSEYQPFYSENAMVFNVFSYLKDYSKFLMNENNDGFDDILTQDNVRGNQGNKLANKAIRKTLSNSFETEDERKAIQNLDFWWLNNGVTIIATSIEQVSPNKFLLKNPQIVNGQQTSRQIIDTLNDLANKQWKVQIKLVIIDDSSDEISRKIKELIILGVNTQTSVTTPAIYGLNRNIRALSTYIEKESNNDVHLIVRKGETFSSGMYYPYEFILQLIVAGFKKLPGEARSSISKVVKDYFTDVFSDENTQSNRYTIAAWINMIKFVDEYDKLFRSDWTEKFKIVNEQKYGDKYAYLAIFRILIYQLKLDENEKLIQLLNYVKIDDSRFIAAINKWHEFMDQQIKKGYQYSNLASYIKSSALSVDLNEFLN